MQKFPAQLVVEGILIAILIGGTPDNKINKQPVEIDVGIFFTEMPPSCKNDALPDTACTSLCIETVLKEASKKHFHLLEHLAYEIHTALTKALPTYLHI